MANRVDSGVQPTAHTAVQAMIVRAQHVASHSGKAIGVHYNLQTDELSLVEIGPDVPTEVSFLRIAAPAGGVPTVAVGSDTEAKEHETPDLKAAPV